MAVGSIPSSPRESRRNPYASLPVPSEPPPPVAPGRFGGLALVLATLALVIAAGAVASPAPATVLLVTSTVLASGGAYAGVGYLREAERDGAIVPVPFAFVVVLVGVVGGSALTVLSAILACLAP
jgi:hypothetical protein